MIRPPAASECPPYYNRYADRVRNAADIYALMAAQPDALRTLTAGLSDAAASQRPAPEEWSVKEVIGHINDGERIMAYRAVWMARADQTPLPGFDQDAFVAAADFNSRSLSGLLDEFAAQRQANLLCLQPLSEEELDRTGTASGGAFTVRSLVYILAGHVDHHLESLRTSYGLG